MQMWEQAQTYKTLRGLRDGIILTNDEEISKAINKAVVFKEASQPSFKEYAQQIIKNAKALGDTLMKEGVSLVSGGTDNHIILLDLRPWNLTGKEAEKLLEDAGMTVNKNTIPYDPKSPFVTSGIRMGTAALTKHGMREEKMKKLGKSWRRY